MSLTLIGLVIEAVAVCVLLVAVWMVDRKRKDAEDELDIERLRSGVLADIVPFPPGEQLPK